MGTFTEESVRGSSEYNLASLEGSDSAFVTFDVSNMGGLFAGSNDFVFTGTIDVVSYLGNNLEDISDYEAASTFVASIDTSTLSQGDILSFDITALYNSLIDSSAESLGIRLQISDDTVTNGGAITFDTFRLTINDQTAVVPVPAAAWLFGSALLGLAGLRRKSSLKSA